VFDQLYSWDQQVLRKINTEWSHPFLDAFLSFIADFNLLKWPLLIGFLALLIFGKFRERAFLGLLAFCLVLGDGGFNAALKRETNRPRPHQSEENIRRIVRDGLGYRVETSDPGPVQQGRSFPSGHVCNNVAAALLLTLFYRPWGMLAWLWVLLIGYSRIYTGDHYPSDVAGSLLFALAYTSAILFAARAAWAWGGPRWAPGLHKKYPDLLDPVPR
jgi:undecaprenyl-diphosphatase